ncbi:MAG: tetratricopeptide repeat-containing protein [Alistipes sp.]|nr:tetratricopeptide repeat-containing protein [Alistipes sp.]
MKSLRIILVAAFAVIGFSAMAQDVNFDDPRYAQWGANAEQRKANMLNSQFLKEAVDNRNYELASGYLNILIKECPSASMNIYTNGAKLYKNMINRAATPELREAYIDSLLWIYDVRLENYASHAKYGKAYILDRKAREFYQYRGSQRDELRAMFDAAIVAGEEQYGKTDLELAVIYFSNVVEDFTNGLFDSDVVLAAYERFSPKFDAAEGDEVEYKEQFESLFGNSGAASCENLEIIFSKKLAAAPEDEALLSRAVTLMARANCSSDFFFDVTEKYYAIKPSSETALFLAQGFQQRGEYDKALKYLEESLSVEADPAEKEKLYVRVGMINLTEKNFSAAMDAAREIKNLNPENGYAYFIIGQCYAASANCGELKCQAVNWAAYDTMSQAVSLLADEPEIQKAAQQMMNRYRANFPTQEECFFAELAAGQRYVISHGLANGVSTTVRFR